MSRQNMTYNRPYPAISASSDSAVIARGKYLVFGAAHCADCHGPSNSDSLYNVGLDVPLAGGFTFDLPLGKIYAKNITPDMETGIGKRTDAEIARTLRYGVHANGKVAIDFMPFHNTSDEDLTAIISYLRTQRPVHHEVPDNSLNAMGKVVNAFLIEPVGPDGEVAVSVQPDTTAAYGAYLAKNVANCYGCHTDRSMTGAFTGVPYAGGLEIEGLITPNLTTDSTSHIFGWSQKNFMDRFRLGKLIKASPMPWNSFKRMSDNDIKAIYNFLQTLEPVKTIKKEIK